jgi:hypothetical protein
MRAIRRLLAGAAVVAATVLAAPVAAHAADAVTVRLSGGGFSGAGRSFSISASYTGTYAPATLTVETAGLTDLATVFVLAYDADGTIGPNPRCTTAGTVVTCPLSASGVPGGLLAPSLYVKAKPGAERGARGAVTATVTMGATSGHATSVYTVADDVDLAVAVPGDAVPGTRGEPVGVPLEVRNLSDRPVDGVGLRLEAYRGLNVIGDFANCAYDEAVGMYCRFDERIPAGGTVVLSGPPLAVTADAAAGTLRYSATVVTGDEFDDANWFGDFRRGTGAALHLVPKAAAQRAVPAIDSNRANNLAFGSVTVAAAPSSPAPTPTAATGPGAAGGGTASGTGGGTDGGGLPITGAPVAAIAGAGLLLLVLGALGVRAARRRRFVA